MARRSRTSPYFSAICCRFQRILYQLLYRLRVSPTPSWVCEDKRKVDAPMTAKMLESFDYTVSVEELRSMVSVIDIRNGLPYVTAMSSQMIRGKLDEWVNLCNSFNLPLLAKAFVLWGRVDGGRPLTDEYGATLFKAINSLP